MQTSRLAGDRVRQLLREERGAVTAEYAVVIMGSV